MLNLAHLLTRWFGFSLPVNTSPVHAHVADDALPLHEVALEASAGTRHNRGRLVEGLADVDEFLDIFPAEAQAVTQDTPDATVLPPRPSAWMLDAEPMEVCLPDGEIVTVWVELGLSHEARTAIAHNLARTFQSDTAPDGAPTTAASTREEREPARVNATVPGDATPGSPRRSRQKSSAGAKARTSREASPRLPRKRTRGPLLAAQQVASPGARR